MYLENFLTNDLKIRNLLPVNRNIIVENKNFDNDLWIYVEMEKSNKSFYGFGNKKIIKNNVLILEINERIGFTSRDGKRLNYPGTNKEYKTVLFESEMKDIVDKIFRPSKI